MTTKPGSYDIGGGADGASRAGYQVDDAQFIVSPVKGEAPFKRSHTPLYNLFHKILNFVDRLRKINFLTGHLERRH